MKRIFRFFRSIIWAIHAMIWCLFHGVKYKKGVYIGLHVKKEFRVKLILSRYSRIAHHTILWGDGKIEIGERSSIGSWSRVFASKNGGVTIGNYTMSASHLYIIDCNHGLKANELIMKQPMVQKPVIIGNDVWMGYHTTILMGVNLEDGVVCGACSVVTKSFPKNSIVAGIPAKVIRTRD